jgi:hypothetical protein
MSSAPLLRLGLDVAGTDKAPTKRQLLSAPVSPEVLSSIHLCPRGVCALPLVSQAGVDPAVDLKFRFTVLGVAAAMASCPISPVITIGAICHSCGTGLPINLCPPAPDAAAEIECQSTPNNQLTTTPSNNDSARLEDQR